MLNINSSNPLPLVASRRGTSYLIVTHNLVLRVLFSNFTVPCGEVTFTSRIVQEDNNGTRTSITGTMTEGSNVEASLENLNLENGRLYRVIVRASNVRNDTTDAESELILVDTTPPLFSGTILDGDPSLTLVDVQYQTDTTNLSVHYDPDSFQDAESGLDPSTFTVAAGSSTYLADLSEPTVADTDRGVITGLHLKHNTSYYMTVSVANRAGLRASASSNGVLVDTTPPLAGVVTVTDGSENILHYVAACKRRITAKIANFKDEESGLASFQWKLCRKASESTVVQCTQQGFATFPCSPDYNCTLDVQHPNDSLLSSGCLAQQYYYQLHIRVWNNAGASTDKISNTFIVGGNDAGGGTDIEISS